MESLHHLANVKEVLRRFGYKDASFMSHRILKDCIPEGAESYLVRDNPRLISLKRRYSDVYSKVVTHSQWRPEYVTREAPLLLFRSDCAYVWQKRDLNFPIHLACTYFYLKAYPLSDLLATCHEDTLFGVYSISAEGKIITRDLLDSVCELHRLRDVLSLTPSSHFTGLDIGSGYGRLAYRLSQCFPNSRVICSDAIPESSFLCEFYLRFRNVEHNARMVPLDELVDEVKGTEIDIAVAINSLTECSSEAVSWWLDLLTERKVPHLLIAGSGSLDGGRLLRTEEYGDHNHPKDLLEIVHQAGYRQIAMIPKFDEPVLQQYGVSPTYYHLFEL